jgi:hypothetical protein
MPTGYPGWWRWPDRDSDGMQTPSLAAVARQQVDRHAGAGGRHTAEGARLDHDRVHRPADPTAQPSTRWPATTPNWVCGMNLAIMDAATEHSKRPGSQCGSNPLNAGLISRALRAKAGPCRPALMRASEPW